MTPLRRLVLPLLAALCALACRVTTDQERYEVGEVGEATFENPLPVDAWVQTCNPFAFEKLEGEAWVPAWVLGDESCTPGAVVRVLPEDRLSFSFPTEAGTWRLSLMVGLGCEEGVPLRRCSWFGRVRSTPFEVTSPGGGCFVGGCNGELCADEPLAGPCWGFPEFSCYRDASCGRFGEPDVHGGCDWKRTPELAECLGALDGPSDRCVVGGCNGELCVDAMSCYGSICVWHPQFACYRDALCGEFGDPEVEGGCAWKQTPELLACLEEHAGPWFTPVELDGGSGQPGPADRERD